MKTEQPLQSDEPVAYDANGNPLYSHPQQVDELVGSKNQTVHVIRPTEPEKPAISEVVKLKNERSKQAFPNLNLSDGEYVISAVRRHPIGLVLPLLLGGILVTISFIALFNSDMITKSLELNGNSISQLVIMFLIILFISLVSIVTYVAYYVYTNNKFFLTNESVIQEIQTSLFSKNEQTVSLANIEDASYVQDNLIQQIFDYGSIRLSTEGDETTYRFTYVSSPKQHIAVLNNAVEAFKNGRPVEDN